MRRSISFLLAAMLATVPARADDKKDQARAYFNAGAQAYSVGQYAPAVQAFDEAWKLAPHASILFSLAQALRRQYFVDKDAAKLQRAVESYRKYIVDVRQGGRRADAVAALEELEPLAERVKAASALAVEVKPPARVMVTSPTKGAHVTVDGGSASEAPYIGELTAGKHTVIVSARGFDDEKRDVAVIEGGLVALDLTLRERPARLDVRAPAGAEILVDGRPSGVTPLAAPLSLSHGRHFVAALRNGARAFVREVDVVRGERSTLDARLERSSQRTAAWITLGVGAAAAAVGGVFAGLAFERQHVATGILEARAVGNVEPSALDDYDVARSARDRWRTASYVAFGAGVGLLATGVGLHVFDRPTVSASQQSFERRPDTPTKAPALDLAVLPAFSPVLSGAVLSGRF